jgi:hypothetical protein
MDATPDKKDTPKLEELSHAQLVQLLRDALDRLKKANERIENLEKGLNGSLPPKLPVPCSVRSEVAHKERKRRLEQKNKEKKKSLRSGRIKTEEKIAKAKRHEDVYPIGVDPSTVTHLLKFGGMLCTMDSYHCITPS